MTKFNYYLSTTKSLKPIKWSEGILHKNYFVSGIWFAYAETKMKHFKSYPKSISPAAILDANLTAIADP